MDSGIPLGTTTSLDGNAMIVTSHLDMSDDEDEEMLLSPESETYDDQNMMDQINDEIASQLASAGPTGVAAAAAISSTKRRKRSHTFETNPSIRKRQQTRLLRKLKTNIEEFSLRVGQQAVILIATPGKQQNNFRVFGAKPLEDVIKNLRAIVMNELETALAHHTPPQPPEDPTLHGLPPLVVEGIPTPVEKMTQAQLRAFIPLMLKYSTGRGKPGWGKDATKPVWWPDGVPWANVRMDARKEDDKQKVSWTHALRQIVINCYKYHGRDDLLPSFDGEDDNNEEDKNDIDEERLVTTNTTASSMMNQYSTTMVQTISNSDGTVSIIQVDPSNPVIALPDGSTAQVQTVTQIDQNQLRLHSTKNEGSPSGETEETHTIELTTTPSGDLQTQDGHILITSDDGHTYPVSVGGIITVPVSANMYQAVVTNMQNGEGTLLGGPIQITPSTNLRGIVTKVDPGPSLTITPVENSSTQEANSSPSQFISRKMQN
ncbi:DNA-binding protein Ewg [Lepeophtheirus salmonis]|uniref:Nuclear respiratory factor 1 NLS/DNA-binding dimerisation domain-containing protein n=1 Tax=Lepeophtheirus salmonis TaxID=72036 RepID=A0A0K2UDT9_LEPSM|nr:DNA-binding protein P3A2-like [Lepeophtheirus salmonis]